MYRKSNLTCHDDPTPILFCFVRRLQGCKGPGRLSICRMAMTGSIGSLFISVHEESHAASGSVLFHRGPLSATSMLKSTQKMPHVRLDIPPLLSLAVLSTSIMLYRYPNHNCLYL